jgi:hypothetical protein
MSFDLRLQITTLVSLNFSSTKFIILLDWLMEAMMKKKNVHIPTLYPSWSADTGNA